MKLSRFKETPRDRGKRLYREGNVQLLTNDDFELSVIISKHTKVSFVKKTFTFKCFNPQCSLWRGQRENKPICYHIWALKFWLIENEKKLSGINGRRTETNK